MMPSRQENFDKPGFPLRLFAAAMLISLLATVLSGWQFWQLYIRFSDSTARQLQLIEYVGRIMLFDEILTMSARLTAATEDFSYERRYDKFDAELDALIKNTEGALDQPQIRQFVAETDDANQKLVAIERRAFALAHQGQRDEATALLASPEYLKWKNVYADGMEKTALAVREVLQTERRGMRNLSAVLVASSGLSLLILLATWFFGVRAAHRWADEQIRSEAVLRTVRDELELRVTERTAELAAHASIIGELASMVQRLQSCGTNDEIADTVSRFAPWILPGVPGALCVLSNSRNRLRIVAAWNEPVGIASDFAPAECWGLRRGQTHIVNGAGREVVCAHVNQSKVTGYSCRPLVAHGEMLGLLYLEAVSASTVAGAEDAEASHDLDVFAENISLALGNQRLHEKLRDQSIHDPLTGLFNRRYLEEALELDIARAARGATSLSLIMGDVDNFKQFNDTFGHDAGDLVLKRVAEAIQAKIRGGDLACRYGGEEFLILLHSAELRQARERADMIREAIKSIELALHGQMLGSVTISLGVATVPVDAAEGAAMITAADAAMYAAKHAGRDRVEVASISGEEVWMAVANTNR